MSEVRRFWSNSRGTAAAEFALVLPLLAVLLFGFYEAGRLFWSYNIVSNSARDAARFAARLPISCAGGSGSFGTGGDDLKVKRLARTGTVDGTGPPLISGWTSDSSVTVALSCTANPVTTAPARTYMGRYQDLAEIPIIRVTASAPYGALFGGLFPGFNLTAVAAQNGQVWTR